LKKEILSGNAGKDLQSLYHFSSEVAWLIALLQTGRLGSFYEYNIYKSFEFLGTNRIIIIQIVFQMWSDYAGWLLKFTIVYAANH
jgi:hypothetical protein